MREGETLKTYSDRYLEMYNEIDGDFEDVAISTFKVGLPVEHGLRKSLTGKPVTNVRQLMDRIDKYKRVEKDQQQGKGKAKIIPQERRDFRLDRFNNNQPRRDYARQSRSANTQRLMQCSENRCIRFWRRLRMSRSSNGRTRWLETLWGTTRAFTANTIRTRDTLQRIAEICGTIWTSWSKKESWSSCCTIPMARRSKQVRIPGKMLLQDLL